MQNPTNNLYNDLNPNFLMLLLISAFFGGVLRSLMGFISGDQKNIGHEELLSQIAIEGIIGMIAGISFYYAGFASFSNFGIEIIVVGLIGYIAADIFNSFHKILFKRKLSLHYSTKHNKLEY